MMQKKNATGKFILYMVMLMVWATTVYAHQIGGIGVGSGLVHPLTGIDHLLAMLAVGIISTRLGGKWTWIVPTIFVSFMIVGAIAAMDGFVFPFAEYAIALSVLVLGAVIAFRKNIPYYAILACVMFFAFAHGHAHGEELPTIADPVLYAIGFTLSTITLHIAGIVIATYTSRSAVRLTLLRYAGVAMAAFAAMLLVFLI